MAIIMTLMAGLFIGCAMGIGLCSTCKPCLDCEDHWPCCGGDETAKVCSPKSPEYRYKVSESTDTNCLHHCYVPNDDDDVRSVNRELAQQYARLFGHWVGQHTGRVEHYNMEQIQRGRSGIGDTLPTSLMPTVAWKIDLRELCTDMGGPEQVRAYLVIKDLKPKYYGTPELELIFAKVGPDDRDDLETGYFNIVHPCPNTCGANSDDELFNAVQTGVAAGRTSVVANHAQHNCNNY